MLIVEDGTGVAQAEAYASDAQGTAYWALYPHNDLADVWTSFAGAVPKREGALREAAGALDRAFFGHFPGRPKAAGQGRLWPRIPVVEPVSSNGETINLYPHRGISQPWRGTRDETVFVDADSVEPDPTVIYGSDRYPLLALPTQLREANILLATYILAGKFFALGLNPEVGMRLKVDQAGDHKFEYFDDGASQQPQAVAWANVLAVISPVLAAGGGQGAWAWR